MESNKLEQLIQINNYLSGQMEENERSVFEDRLKNENDLKEELEFSAHLLQSEKSKELFEIKSWINQGIDESLSDKGSSKFTNLSSWILGFVLMSLLVLSGWLFYQQQQHAIIDQLIAPELLPLELVLYADNTNDKNLQLGFANYKKADYSNAINKLEAYWSKSKDVNIALYIGVSSLLSDQPSKAESWLKIAEGEVEPPMDEIVRWYLVLTYLKSYQKSKALQLMQDWPEGGLYYEKAYQLNESL